MAAGDPTEAGDERLDPAVREAERLTLMLRTRGGIKLSRRNADFSPMDACIDDLSGVGLLETDGDRVTLTRATAACSPNDVVARSAGRSGRIGPALPAGTR